MRDSRRLLLVVGLVLAWSSTFAAVKVGVESASPVLFAGLRSVIGGAVMLPVAIWLGRSPGLREQLPAYAALTALNVVGFFGLQTLAIDALPSGLAAVLIYLQPVLTGVLAGPLLGEHVPPRAFLGLGLGFGGIVAISSGALHGHVSALGIGYALAGALVWSLGTITTKRTVTRVDGWWAVALPFTAGGVVLTGLGAVAGPRVEWSGDFVVALLYSALVGTSLAWALWFALVRSGEATRAAAVIFFVPLLAVALGVLLLGEPVHASLLLGAALVVLGVWLVNRRPLRSTAGSRRTAPRSR